MTVTYGVLGLIDWNVALPVGQAHIRIHFTGGAITKYGITAAEFTTSNYVMQRVIEGSQHFKTGRIVKLRTSKH